MMFHRESLLLSISLLLLTSVSFGQWAIVPVDHPIYPFLERMEAKGLISGYFDTTLPLDEGQICQFLSQLDRSKSVLTSVDRDWLLYFRREFWEWNWSKPLESHQLSGWQLARKIGFLKWLKVGNFWKRSHDWFSGYGDTYAWTVNPILRADIVSDENYDNVIWRRTSGVSFRMVWYSKFGVFFRFHDTTEQGNGPYYSRTQVYDDRYGYIGPLLGDNFTYYDRTDYGIHFRWGRIRLEAGKWQNRWGPGQYGHLLLSDEGTSFDQIRLKVDIGDWGQLTALTGTLQQYPPIGDTLYQSVTGQYRVIESSKFVSAHRLDVKPIRNLELGFSEMVVYADRGMVLGYLIPLNLYFSAQHYYGDQDNVMWAVDAKYTGIRRVRCYGEILIDDMTISKLGTSYWGNKFAGLVGSWWTDPMGLSNLSIGTELTAIRPYVYSHQFVENLPTHWTRPLGYWSPPNSLTWTIGGTYQPLRSIELSVRFDYQKQGVNTDSLNVGSNPYFPHRSTDPENVAFLAGDIQESRFVSGSISWEFLPRFRMIVWGGSRSELSGDSNWIQGGFYLNF
jgi:hypothetical protein